MLMRFNLLVGIFTVAICEKERRGKQYQNQKQNERP
jgi:hypothetical protein